MPTQTFFKLKAEKRQKITDIALNAFAVQDFEAVSITRLMQDLEMPKGSFYQYFEDKRDVYFYLFEHFQQKKDTHLASQVAAGKMSFWENWEDWLLAELRYYWQNPIEWNFWLNAHCERSSPLLGNLQGLIQNKMAQQFLPTLKHEGRQGNLKQDAPHELQAYFLGQASAGITAYILHKFALNLGHTITQKQVLPAFPAIEIRLIIQQWFSLLKKGTFE